MNKLSKFYNKNESEKMIKRRYENCIPSIRMTLKKLVPTKKFQSIKTSLSSQGWKDWHILMGIFNFIMNYRMDKLGILGDQLSMIKFQETYTYQEENDSSIQIPMSIITEQNIKIGLDISMPATINALGFSIPQNIRIDKDKIRKILDSYNYWEDDIDHDAIFEI